MEVYNEWDETLAKYGLSSKKILGKEITFTVHNLLQDHGGGEGLHTGSTMDAIITGVNHTERGRDKILILLLSTYNGMLILRQENKKPLVQLTATPIGSSYSVYECCIHERK